MRAAHALAPAEVSKILFKNGYEPFFDASLLPAEKARAMAGAAGSIVAARDDGADAVVAGGCAGERGVIFLTVIPALRSMGFGIHHHDRGFGSEIAATSE